MPVAIITGAARGIGAATAIALAEVGHDIVLIDRCGPDPRLGYALATEEELNEIAKRTGGTPIIGNAADPAVLDRAKAAAESLGSIEIAVAAAGVIAGEGPAWELSNDAWQALEETNITAVRRLAAATIPAMLDRPRPRFGRFIAIGSPIAHKATPRLAAYAASKAAVESYVRSLAADLAGTDITANIVLPGSTDTGLLAHSATVYDLDSPERFAEHHLVDRLISPDEVAATITWLCGSGANAITGAAIAVDGGFSAR